jgi:sphingosine-1-phosphate phosphatase 1
MWCVVVCTSRLYLGMHSVADLVVGLILAFILFIPLVTFGKFTGKIFWGSHKEATCI